MSDTMTFKGQVDNNVLYLWRSSTKEDGLQKIYVLFEDDGIIAITAEYDKWYCDDKKFDGEIIKLSKKVIATAANMQQFILDVIRRYLKTDENLINFLPHSIYSNDDYDEEMQLSVLPRNVHRERPSPHRVFMRELENLMLRTGVAVKPGSEQSQAVEETAQPPTHMIDKK